MRLEELALLLLCGLSACSASSGGSEVDPGQASEAALASSGLLKGESPCRSAVSGKELAPKAGAEACPECTFTHALILSLVAGTCHFTGNVLRSGCADHPADQWAVDVSMNCGDPVQTRTFYLDDEGQIPAYELSLSCRQG